MSARYAAGREEVQHLVSAWSLPRYRTDQIIDGLWKQRAPLERLTALPAELRARLAEVLPLALDEVAVRTSRDGMTTKWLWSARGAEIETVLMRSRKRASVCVSSQAGCAMACTFCATGQAGFERNLDAGEILEQVVRAQHATGQRVSHVVFMGMGEPLANYEPVWESVERLHRDLGLSSRHITVSTVGVVPGLHRLARETLPVTLAVSLHAPTDELRETLVPLDRRYPIAEVLDAAAGVAATRGRRVTFEYAAIDGVNDAPELADALGARLRRFPGPGGAHVNIIPLNPTAGFPGRAPAPERLRTFRERLAAHGVAATIRRNRGVDIDAACGQLRWRHREQ